MFKQADETHLPWILEQGRTLFDPPFDARTLQWAVARGSAWVAEEADGPVAFFVVGPALSRKTLRMLALAVVPERQNRGLGQQAVRHIVDYATLHGFQQLVCEVAESNGPALQFYGTIGAVEIGRRPNYYTHKNGATEDAIVMSLTL
jgi:ribosomal protein S18 acetylase RimI-like enzyme